MIKNYLLLFFFLITFSLAWSFIQSPLLAKSPCAVPISYRIGDVDPRFHLTASQVESDVSAAAGIWKWNSGEPLFIPSSPSAILVNFVYDDRSALNSEIYQKETKLGQSSQDLNRDISQFDQDEQNFKQKLAEFNRTVQEYNRQGGAPPDVYQQLVNRQQELVREGNALNARAKQLNLAAQNYNSQLQDLNQNVALFNSALSQRPEAGLYNPAGQVISVYFVSDQKELVHTLAHEFGHALGLPHASNSAAIMYPFTTGSLFLTSEDKRELATACRPQPLAYYWSQALRRFFVSLR